LTKTTTSQNLIFISLFYKWKALAHVQSLLPSAKGLSFTFMLSLHLLPLCTVWESIVVILSLMCIVPKLSLIDSWLWFHLLLNCLYLVAILNLEGVLCIYVLLFHKGQAKNHLLCFPYGWNTHVTFIVSLFMIFRLCSFSCYNMVAKFLLLRLCLSWPCFKFFDLSTQCFT
jgi:hypothetical protein